MSKIMMSTPYSSEFIVSGYPAPKIELHEPHIYQDYSFPSPIPLSINLGPQSDNSPPSPPDSLSSLSPQISPNATSSLTETLAKASSLADSFYPEFHQYSKETYEQSANSSRKRRRAGGADASVKNGERENEENEGGENSSEGDEEGEVNGNSISNAEIRRQIHIQSEQKRRAQIKDGFEDLRKQLPGCLNKKMSKAALLNRTVQHIRHLKNIEAILMQELERLTAENEQLRKFQESFLQKQALEKMYQIGSL